MANSKRISNEELAEIRKRAEKATEGPWNIENVEHQSYAIMSPEYLYGEMFVVAVKDDAIFIAKAREDIPKLLAEVEMLRGQNERLLQFLHAEGYISDHEEIDEEGLE